ncbi:MAG: tetratricopeptide repeat protein [Leptolyngbyaceae cyanobacterium CSU_1_4]|nr:tetratricopeptide repeat protein [Leptolyngbyaceae cyanobacterium CSU_1_4]
MLRGLAVLHINAAWLNTRINNSQICLMHASQADKLLEPLVETELNLKVLNILGTAADNLNKYDLALHYYERSVTIAQKLHLRIREAMTRQNMGHVYSFLGQYEKAIAEYSVS